MTQKTVKPAPSNFFHEKQSEEDELLKLSLKESRRAKKEREKIKWKVKPTKIFYMILQSSLEKAKLIVWRITSNNLTMLDTSNCWLTVDFIATNLSIPKSI